MSKGRDVIARRKSVTSVVITLAIIAMLILSQSTLGLTVTFQGDTSTSTGQTIHFQAVIRIDSQEWANITSVTLNITKDGQPILSNAHLPVGLSGTWSNNSFNNTYGPLIVTINTTATNATYGYGYGYGYGYSYLGWRYGYGYGYGYGYYSGYGYGYNVIGNVYPAVIVYDFVWTPRSAGTYNFNITVTVVNGGVHHISAGHTVTVSAAPVTTTVTTPAPSAGGGAGGGGGVVVSASEVLSAPSAVYTTTIITVTPGIEVPIEITGTVASETGVYKIIILYDKATMLQAIVSKISSLPAGIPSPPGEVFSAFEIVFVKYGTSEKVEPSGYIEFKVPKSWLNEKGYTKDQIVLVKWKDGKWIELPTEVIKEDDSYVYYKAKLSSFSLFAIIAKAAPVVTTTEVPVTTTVVPTTTAVVPTTTVAVKPPAVSPTVIAGIIVAIIVIAIVIYAVTRRK